MAETQELLKCLCVFICQKHQYITEESLHFFWLFSSYQGCVAFMSKRGKPRSEILWIWKLRPFYTHFYSPEHTESVVKLSEYNTDDWNNQAEC